MSPDTTHSPIIQPPMALRRPRTAQPDQGLGAISPLNASRDVTASGIPKSKINARPVHNRIFAVMMHTNRYAFKSQVRLAADCQVAPSTICRLLTGHCSPSFALIAAVTGALEKQLHRRIDPRELVSADGVYATPWTCSLCGCGGCLPDEAYDQDDRLRPEYMDVRPGEWTNLTFRFISRALAENDFPGSQLIAAGSRNSKTGIRRSAGSQERK